MAEGESVEGRESQSEEERFEPPRGALLLALLFGGLAVIVWLAIYFGIFVQRG